MILHLNSYLNSNGIGPHAYQPKKINQPHVHQASKKNTPKIVKLTSPE